MRLGAALVPEGRQIFTSLSVIENLKLGATIRRDAEIASDLEAVFAEFPVLAERRRQMAGLLSGGEQQMLAIARALMSRPRLLMLDEPSLGLAPMAIARVYDKLTAIRSRGVAILVAEQNAARAFAVADRVLIMSHGRFSLSGRPDEIRGASRFRRRLFWRGDERRELVLMREAAQVLVDAISVGGLYALTALGIGMIFGVMRLKALSVKAIQRWRTISTPAAFAATSSSREARSSNPPRNS